MICDSLDEFVDGELSLSAAAAYRLHLPDCVRCQLVLGGRLQEKMVTAMKESDVSSPPEVYRQLTLYRALYRRKPQRRPSTSLALASYVENYIDAIDDGDLVAQARSLLELRMCVMPESVVVRPALPRPELRPSWPVRAWRRLFGGRQADAP